MSVKEIKEKIQSAVQHFSGGDLTSQSRDLFNALGYNTKRQAPLDKKTYKGFKEAYLDGNASFSEEKSLVAEWKQVDLLFQLSKEEVTTQHGLFETKQVDQTIIETYLFFVIELSKENYSRTSLSQIAREVNKVFLMPVMVLFRYGSILTLAVINRRIHKHDKSKDVLKKVTLIKDIDIEHPHRAHIDILFDLSFNELQRVHKFSNFVELHNAWQKTLDTKELNKKFYKELSNWYFWALGEVDFPGASHEADKKSLFKEDEKEKEHNAKNVIRLLTRLLFVWFVKEKGLIPEELFDENCVGNELLVNFKPKKEHRGAPGTHSRYYRAILQNLFFASLNQAMGNRQFRKSGQHMNVTNLMRYERYFKDPKKFVQLVEKVVPFMNGGLFECLDAPDSGKKGRQGGDVIVYLDGFSDREDNALSVPDYLFFGEEAHVDLSEAYGDKAKEYKSAAVKGLINILKSYKFTVAENTPLEEEVALDPELLGQVFENLLASYNPETKTTARKQTGSFYTPREIVNYMVDESLFAYFKQKLEESGIKEKENFLHDLIGWSEIPNPFNNQETKLLIAAIDNCKILDPACGSGAFPMGVLHKLCVVLHKLDPKSGLWKQKQIEKAQAMDDSAIRDQLVADIEEAFENNELDYGRKLYLIENCIYGIDIQPIATQISKLRFFISLIVDQKVNAKKDNFGVRPLPNLETKFVAANTLIGIEKPKAQMTLGSAEIKDLEEQLKGVRHRLFSAKTPSTKRKLREEDKVLREKMGDLLIQSGWGHETARQLASWDPYDQNASSLFFDSEWMFGIADGFDVVIGNPPYGVSIKGDYRKAVIKNLGKVPDYEIYYYFIDVAWKYLGNKGINTYIIPNTFLFNVFASAYRKKLIDCWNIECIIDCTAFKIFEGATVFNAISVLAKGKEGDGKVGYKITSGALSFLELSTRETKYLSPLELLENNQNWGLVFKLPRSILNVISKIRKSSVPLEILFPEYSQGLIAYDKYQGQAADIIESRAYHYKTKVKPGLKEWLWGEDVRRYVVQWNGQEWIDYCKGIANPRQPKFFQGPRILIREITNPAIFCAYTDQELYHDPAVIVVLDNDNKIKMLLGLLNSKLASFYHFNASPKATKGAFPKILVEDIKSFPIKKLGKKECSLLICLVDYVLLLSQKNKDSSFLEQCIDSLVYELYFPDEIKSAGCVVLKQLTDLPVLKADWSDQKKMSVIEKVSQELSDPKHQVSIAMAKMHAIPEVMIIEGRGQETGAAFEGSNPGSGYDK